MEMKRTALNLMAALSVALILPSAGAASAQQQLIPSQSSLRFVSRQMGVPVEGKFRRFSVASQFDPGHPESSTVRLEIDLTSVDIGNGDTEAELKKPGWFDSLRRPTASFRSSKVIALSPGRFDVQGVLSIKGVDQQVTVPVRLSQRAGVTVAQGTLQIKRMDYRIGDGEWNDISIVANEVRIHFQLSLSGVAAI